MTATGRIVTESKENQAMGAGAATDLTLLDRGQRCSPRPSFLGAADLAAHALPRLRSSAAGLVASGDELGSRLLAKVLAALGHNEMASASALLTVFAVPDVFLKAFFFPSRSHLHPLLPDQEYFPVDGVEFLLHELCNADDGCYVLHGLRSFVTPLSHASGAEDGHHHRPQRQIGRHFRRSRCLRRAHHHDRQAHIPACDGAASSSASPVAATAAGFHVVPRHPRIWTWGTLLTTLGGEDQKLVITRAPAPTPTNSGSTTWPSSTDLHLVNASPPPSR